MALQISTLLDRKTLIVGDINTGKTTLTRQILNEIYHSFHLGSQILLLDLSPTLPETLSLPDAQRGVGGRVIQNSTDYPDILHLCPKLLPPRLMSNGEAEAASIAQANLAQIQLLLDQHIPLDQSLLCINDITIYLQAGHATDLLSWMGLAQTVIANGYLGKQLGQGRLSTREREQMQILIECFDHVISLPEADLDILYRCST